MRRMVCSECHQDKKNRLAAHRYNPNFSNCAVGTFIPILQSPPAFQSPLSRNPKASFHCHCNTSKSTDSKKTTIPSTSTLLSPSSSAPRRPPTRRSRLWFVCRRFRTTRSRSSTSAFGRWLRASYGCCRELRRLRNCRLVE